MIDLWWLVVIIAVVMSEMENRVSRNVSTVTGGITMALAGDGRDEEESRVREIDVLKNVVLREEYIRRLESTYCVRALYWPLSW